MRDVPRPPGTRPARPPGIPRDDGRRARRLGVGSGGSPMARWAAPADDGDMTETSSPTGEGPAGPPPPPPPPGPWGAPPPPPPGGGTQSAGDALRRIRRRPDDKVIGGVAAAIARALDIDPVIIRIAFVALAVCGGSGIVLYAAAWALIPEWPEERSWLARTLEGRNGTAAVVLTVLGALILVPVALRALWWGPWDGGPFVLLPIALIALGVV